MEINNNISSTIPLVDIVLVFCYVFSFYVIGPLTSSVIIALPLMFCCLYKKKWGYCLLLELKNSFIVRIFISQWLLIGIAVFYSCLHLTMELEYIKVLIAQMFHYYLFKISETIYHVKNRANYYMGFSSTIYYSIDSYVYTIICTFYSLF